MFVNPRRAHAQRGLLYFVCVCVSVCLFLLIWHPRLQGSKTAIPVASVLRGHCFSLNRFVQNLWRETPAKSQYTNEFKFTADGICALPRSTKHGNNLMGNWWSERCLRGRWRPVRGEKNRQALERCEAARSDRYAHAQRFSLLFHSQSMWGSLSPIDWHVLWQLFYFSMHGEFEVEW